jgi:DUF4097 and DUF4098 domain-containing protein YvlB
MNFLKSHRSRMAAPLTLIALGALVLNVLGAERASNLKQSIAVQPGGMLVVHVDMGAIHITTGNRDDVQVEVRRKVTNADAAQAAEIFAAHEVSITGEGERVNVRARLQKDFTRLFSRTRTQFHVEYRITMPRQFHLDLRTSAGSIHASDVQGNVKAQTAGGSLKFANVTGTFDGTTSAGSITVGDVTGPVTAKTSGGTMRFGEMGSDAVVETSAGSISVKSAKAKLTARTRGGGIEAHELTGPAYLETSAGSIRVKSAHARLEAKTSGGSITIDDARDTVLANTSAGSVTAAFSEQPQEDCRLTTSGGSITVKLNSRLAFNVDAKTSGGRVTTELPITATILGDYRTDGLKGTLNGGGKVLFLRTSAGNITIKK